MKLLSRDEFREGVFARDKHVCVICGQAAVDAHHILDRKLFEDNGYYLENGASVCADHHYDCETTKISVKDIRSAAKIKTICVPDHLEIDQEYDKWGNAILPNKQRLKGEMFNLPNVQKILQEGNFLNLFTDYIKYPRTFHLPWSEELTSDDKFLKSLSGLENQEVVVTIKMDGENSSLYHDYLHARSLDSKHHPSRDWLKQFHASIKNDIPKDWRVCGENLYAKHSIEYNDLESFFYGFSIWNEKNVALGWDETLEYFQLLGIKSVPVIYRGIFDEDKIKSCWTDELRQKHEGYVVRTTQEISYNDFKRKAAKMVRQAHVKTQSVHWMTATVVPNKLL